MTRLLLRAFLRDDSGQAFVESAFFLPMLAVAMFAIIFFTRLGVLSERAETAVRYGDLVSFRNGGAYSVSAISYLLQMAVFGNTPSQLLDLCLVPGTSTPAPNATPTGINGDIRQALVQNQQAPGATATTVPSAKPFFQPDSVSQPNCSPGSIDLNGDQNYSTVGALPIAVDSFSITATVNSPLFIHADFMNNGCSPANGAAACASTTSKMSFVNVAAPTTLIACVPGMSIVLKILNAGAGSVPCY